MPHSRNLAHRRRRGGFTLVEMLVVITIIGILAALAVPATFMGIRAARQTAIKAEITDMQRAVEAYKDKTTDFFPDFTQAIDPNAPSVDQFWNTSIAGRHMKKMARRAYASGNNPGSQNLAAITWTDVNAAYPVTTGNVLYADLDAAEALVFFLGGISNNIERPFSGVGGPLDRDPNNLLERNPTSDFSPFFPFDETRLRDEDGDGFLEYYPKFDIPLPYVYFDSRSYSLTDVNGNPTAVYPPLNARNPSNEVRPYLRDSSSATPQFAASPGFQIISAGLDGEFGTYPQTVQPANAKAWRSGLNYDLQDHDNITSFSERTTLGGDLP